MLKDYFPACFCGSLMRLRRGKFGLFYACQRHPDCDGQMRCDDSGTPVGIVTNAKLRLLRIHLHRILDLQWKTKPPDKRKAARHRAYANLAKALNLTDAEWGSPLLCL